MKFVFTCILTVVVLMLVASEGLAADSGPSTPAADNLATARARIADRNWPAAIEELTRVNDSGSADWNNLMAYSLRKSGTANYAAAEKFYDEALRIDRSTAPRSSTPGNCISPWVTCPRPSGAWRRWTSFACCRARNTPI